MTDLPFTTPAEDPTRPARPPRKCRGHEWTWIGDTPEQGEHCRYCPAIRDVIRERRGRTNRSRGLSIQRTVAHDLGMEHIRCLLGVKAVSAHGGNQ